MGAMEEGNVMTRHLAGSTLYFMWTGINITSNTQRTTMRTESTPLDLLVFDEVQGMTSSQIEKTKERMSASLLRASGMVSTARWPEADIHEHFLRTNQQYWHSDCRCPDGVVLSEEWPNCIGQSDGRIFYLCPRCETEITDPQKGRYIAHADSIKRGNGFHFAQTLSRRISPASVWQAWLESTDKQNFYNRKLGKPYSNPDEIPISLELLKRKAFNPDLSWANAGGENYMGVDHMGALSVVVVKQKAADGERIIHLEWIEDLDPFKRTGQLMDEFNVRYCALENEPNYNEAFRFAKDFPGRVFVVEYSGGQIAGEMLRWADRSKQDPEAIRKTSDEARMQWSVRCDQYKFMSFSLGKIKDGVLRMPDPYAKPLMRDRLIKGHMVPSNIAELFTSHLTKVALRSIRDDKQNKFKNLVEKVGSEDPHFTYANMCCDVAIARAYGTTRILTSEIGREMDKKEAQEATQDVYLKQIREAIPQVGQIEQEVCGNCVNFKPTKDGTRGWCLGEKWHNHKMLATDLKCDEYQEVGRDG